MATPRKRSAVNSDGPTDPTITTEPSTPSSTWWKRFWVIVSWERFARILALLAIILSAYSANQSRIAAEASRAQSASSLLIQTRLSSMKQFSLAYGELDAALIEGGAQTSDAQVDLEEPAQIMDLSLQSARRLSIPLRRALNAFRAFDAEVNGSRGMWSDGAEALGNAGMASPIGNFDDE